MDATLLLEQVPETGLIPDKFVDPDTTASGARRAAVGFKALRTLWVSILSIISTPGLWKTQLILAVSLHCHLTLPTFG